MLKCAWIDKDTEESCNADAKIFYSHFAICDKHRNSMSIFIQNKINLAFYELYQKKQLDTWSLGYTYIVILPNGNVKIGYVTTAERLYKRWQEISRKFGGKVTVVSVMDGGRTHEAVLHITYHDFRLENETLEQFSPTTELLSSAVAAGIPQPEVQSQLALFLSWQPTKAWSEYAHSESAHLEDTPAN